MHTSTKHTAKLELYKIHYRPVRDYSYLSDPFSLIWMIGATPPTIGTHVIFKDSQELILCSVNIARFPDSSNTIQRNFTHNYMYRHQKYMHMYIVYILCDQLQESGPFETFCFQYAAVACCMHE